MKKPWPYNPNVLGLILRTPNKGPGFLNQVPGVSHITTLSPDSACLRASWRPLKAPSPGSPRSFNGSFRGCFEGSFKGSTKGSYKGSIQGSFKGSYKGSYKGSL